jgi:hypothetical protein
LGADHPNRRLLRFIWLVEKRDRRAAEGVLVAEERIGSGAQSARAVRSCPPSVDDFRSHESLGLPYPRAMFVRATGISVFRSRAALARVRRRFRLGSFTAALDLDSRDVAWAETGRAGHLTVWANPELLLERVIQCDGGH